MTYTPVLRELNKNYDMKFVLERVCTHFDWYILVCENTNLFIGIIWQFNYFMSWFTLFVCDYNIIYRIFQLNYYFQISYSWGNVERTCGRNGTNYTYNPNPFYYSRREVLTWLPSALPYIDVGLRFIHMFWFNIISTAMPRTWGQYQYG